MLGGTCVEVRVTRGVFEDDELISVCRGLEGTATATATASAAADPATASAAATASVAATDAATASATATATASAAATASAPPAPPRCFASANYYSRHPLVWRTAFLEPSTAGYSAPCGTNTCVQHVCPSHDLPMICP